MKIFIIGEVDGLYRPGVNAKFKHTAQYLQIFGHVAVNPLELTPEGQSYDQAFDVRMTALDKCDAVFIQPDWIDSKEARRQLNHALTMNLKTINMDNIQKFVEEPFK